MKDIDDTKKPLLEHLIELRRRLLVGEQLGEPADAGRRRGRVVGQQGERRDRQRRQFARNRYFASNRSAERTTSAISNPACASIGSISQLKVECSSRTCSSISARREERWWLVDFWGKGNKRRTVPVPEWAGIDLLAWKRDCEGIQPLLTNDGRPMTHDRSLIAGGIKGDTLHQMVQTYGAKMGFPELCPHDLRRTLAKMLRKSGAELEQIQLTLGHAALSTTELYLGSTLELGKGSAAIDRVRLEGR